ncbi:MATH and LRR domain-containing protein PFE0570w-like [Leptopilina heterotoma]|uniref:MATH and LRR domain-containing protein PFE0570w-like n=1 Tax=Leptopilina heterotoma TaxID=63436 RepID=UPI001CA7E587|nr:MATH and LRR domain-containing protein PFE0570w-like [Leptopilina heterotoma]
MAPTVCMTDFPEMGNSHKCARRRQRIQDRSISKREKVELKKVVSKNIEIQEMKLLSSSSHHQLGPNSRQKFPTDSYVPIILSSSRQISTVTSSGPDNQWKMSMRRDGLVDIFIRTIALVRRNHILQRRVKALREETQNFISSMMMNNSGNESENENISYHESNSQVSSTTENNNSRSSSLFKENSKISSKSFNSKTEEKTNQDSKFHSKFINDSRTDRELNKVSSSSEVVVTRTNA